MDGIFGIGIAEMIIVALALFIVGGPENTAKWARQAGKLVRQLRQQWAEMMSQVERELGPEGKEIMDVTREFSRNTQDLRRATSPRHLMSETTRYVERSVKDAVAPTATPTDSSAENPASSSTGTASDLSGEKPKYGAWVPRDED